MARAARALLTLSLMTAACGKHGLGVGRRADADILADVNQLGPDAPATYRESTERFVQIAAGYEETCGITTDGRVLCWGLLGDCRDIEGECPSQRGYVPKKVGQTGKSLSVYIGYSCAINENDSIDCWGQSDAPPHIEGAFSKLAAPMAIRKSDGAIIAWEDAQVMRLIPNGTFVDVSGYGYYCGLRSDGTLACWGSTRTDGVTDQPPPGNNFTRVVASGDSGCALRDDEQVVCWGTGTRSWTSSPDFTPQPDGVFVQIDQEAMSICGIRTDGSLACWGALYGYQPPQGSYIQIALGGTSNPLPNEGSSFFCALRTDGIVVCWGEDSAGESTPT
jgi:hypothetical protein